MTFAGRALLEDRMAFPQRGLDGFQIRSTQRYDVFKEHPQTAALGSGVYFVLCTFQVHAIKACPEPIKMNIFSIQCDSLWKSHRERH